MTCPNCGGPESQIIPVWEDMDRYEADEQPKFLGCKSCHRMMRADLLEEVPEDRPSQLQLTDREIARVPIGNQHDDDLTLIEWQCVKGAAVHYGVRDWISMADESLTKEENVALMKRRGCQSGRTLRHQPTPQTD